MARGITQDQVNAAIDALVVAGERPTIERVRAALGTGSPNTLTRMLDTWWAALGDRLSLQRQKVAMPDAPCEVSALASQLWEQALRSACVEAHNALEGERARMESDRVQLATERVQIQQAIATQSLVVAAAEQAQTLAETRLADAQQLAERHGQQLVDVLRQRDALQARVDQLTEDMAALGTRLRQQETTAAAQRESQAQHLRTIEDRSHLEVDRARQETKELRVQHTALEREHALREKQRDETRAALSAAQREAASHRARSETLEKQLARLGELHAALAKAQGSTSPKRSARQKKAPARRAPPRIPAAR